MINFDHLKMRFRPFPMGVIRPAMPDDVYAECMRAFPEKDRFEYIGDVGHKFSISEKYAFNDYKDLIRNEPVWREFHRWIKSAEFIEATFQALSERSVDLGYQSPSMRRRVERWLKVMWRGRGRRIDQYSARFEFSALPAYGGSILPHTDNPDKLITLVVSMVGGGEWPPAYGGGTDVLQPIDEALTFDYLNNRHPAYSNFETLHTYPFNPNQVLIFTKTFNSWHGVRPMTGPDDGLMRRSLTINIEAR
ncbi:MAG: hypothetical protein VCB25_07850 [Myxococcota bacterium]